MTGVLVKELMRTDRRAQGGLGANVEAESRAVHLQAKERGMGPVCPQSPQQELPAPRFWTSSLHNCETVPFCGFSHPVCGTLFWPPSGMNTPGGTGPGVGSRPKLVQLEWHLTVAGATYMDFVAFCWIAPEAGAAAAAMFATIRESCSEWRPQRGRPPERCRGEGWGWREGRS